MLRIGLAIFALVGLSVLSFWFSLEPGDSEPIKPPAAEEPRSEGLKSDAVRRGSASRLNAAAVGSGAASHGKGPESIGAGPGLELIGGALEVWVYEGSEGDFRGVDGARLHVHRDGAESYETFLTDADGNATLTLDAEAFSTLLVVKDGRRVLRRLEGGTQSLELHLPRAVWIEARVQDQRKGRAVAGALVSYKYIDLADQSEPDLPKGLGLSVKSDEQGRIRIPLPPWRSALRVEAKGYATKTVLENDWNQLKLIELYRQRALTLNFETEGPPLPDDLDVHMIAFRPEAGWSRRLSCASDERLPLADGPPHKVFRVAVEGEHYLAGTPWVVLKADDDRVLRVPLIRRARQALRLLDAQTGAAVAGVRATLQGALLPKGAQQLTIESSGESDAAGELTLQGILDKRRWIRVDSSLWHSAPSGVNFEDGVDEEEARLYFHEHGRAKSVPIDMPLARFRSLSGSVTDAEGQALAGAILTVAWPQTDHRRRMRPAPWTRSEAGGRFKIDGIEASRVRLEVTIPGRSIFRTEWFSLGSEADVIAPPQPVLKLGLFLDLEALSGISAYLADPRARRPASPVSTSNQSGRAPSECGGRNLRTSARLALGLRARWAGHSSGQLPRRTARRGQQSRTPLPARPALDADADQLRWQ